MNPPSRPRQPASMRHRLAVASRCLAAIGGGYTLAAVSSAVLALCLPLSREEIVMAATMPAFLIFAAAVVWAFVATTAWRAWLGIGVPASILGMVLWWL